jgi:lipoprotein-anchoring transpeptidase ErfK/SrfK
MMMRMGGHIWLVAAIVQGASLALPGAAAAQLLFDWGGQEKVNDSGRQLVRINLDAKPGEIIVSFTDRRLYFITAPGQALSYPVAIPREQDRWEGRTSVSQKRENPSWTPTPSMLKENPRLPRWVPGGHPMNPLGNRALYLGSSFYRIHGTDAPWTIGTAVSKGCIRMYNKDALDLYERTKVGARVLVTWKAYEVRPESEALQAQLPPLRDEAPATTTRGRNARTGDNQAVVPASTTAGAAAPTAAAAPAATVQRPRPETRYSDIYGTPEPGIGTPAVREPAAPQAAEAAPAAPARQSRQTRDSAQQQQPQPPAQPRRNREAATDSSPTTDSGTAAQGGAARASASRVSEPRQRTTPIETGAVPEPRRSQARASAAAPVPAAPPTSDPFMSGDTASSPATAPARSAPADAVAAREPQADLAARALEAAERAAAAAERAAAAAERAERAAAARAAASERAIERTVERPVERSVERSVAPPPAAVQESPRAVEAPAAGSSD